MVSVRLCPCEAAKYTKQDGLAKQPGGSRYGRYIPAQEIMDADMGST